MTITCFQFSKFLNNLGISSESSHSVGIISQRIVLKQMVITTCWAACKFVFHILDFVDFWVILLHDIQAQSVGTSCVVNFVFVTAVVTPSTATCKSTCKLTSNATTTYGRSNDTILLRPTTPSSIWIKLIPIMIFKIRHLFHRIYNYQSELEIQNIQVVYSYSRYDWLRALFSPTLARALQTESMECRMHEINFLISLAWVKRELLHSTSLSVIETIAAYQW